MSWSVQGGGGQSGRTLPRGELRGGQPYSPQSLRPGRGDGEHPSEKHRAGQGAQGQDPHRHGDTDARLWRYEGIPAYVYGPYPRNMGSSDENVEVEEFIDVVKTHALSAYDCLRQTES